MCSQNRQQPGFGLRPRSHRHRAGGHRRGRFLARGGQGDHRRAVQPQHRLRPARDRRSAKTRSRPSGCGRRCYRRTMYFGRTSVDDHRHGRGRHGAVGFERQALRRADPSPAGRQAARPDQGLRLDSVRPRRPRNGRHRPPLARRRLSRREIRLGADGAQRNYRHRPGARRPRGLGDGTVLIDAGCVWDARTALRRAHAFAEFGIEWLEEPLRPRRLDGYAWLRDRSPVPIASGEEECGREAFRP